MTNEDTPPVSGGSIPPAPTWMCSVCDREIEYYAYYVEGNDEFLHTTDHGWEEGIGWFYCNYPTEGYGHLPHQNHKKQDPLVRLVREHVSE